MHKRLKWIKKIFFNKTEDCFKKKKKNRAEAEIAPFCLSILSKYLSVKEFFFFFFLILREEKYFEKKTLQTPSILPINVTSGIRLAVPLF